MTILWMKIPKTIAEQVFFDTLTVNGRFAWKRVGAFATLHFGFVYSILPFIKPEFKIESVVVFSAFTLAAGLMGIDLKQKIETDKINSNINIEPTIEEQEQQ